MFYDTTRENPGLLEIPDRGFVVIRPAEHISEGVAESPVLPGQIMAHPAAHVSEGSGSRIRSPLNPFLNLFRAPDVISVSMLHRE